MSKVGRPKGQMVEVECANPTCESRWEKYPSAVARSKTGRFVCSNECRNVVGSKPKTGVLKVCEWCIDDYYVPKALIEKSRFCSAACRDEGNKVGVEARICEGCGETFEFNLKMKKWNAGKYHSRECMHAHRRAQAIGSTYKNPQGYIVEFQPDSPMAQPSTGNLFQHRRVLAEKIGRPLEPHENPHHKNGIKDDNRPENLELWSTSQPAGQSVVDKIAWAKEFCALYGYDVVATDPII